MLSTRCKNSWHALALGSTLALLATFSATTATAAGEPGSVVRRTTLIVADIEASIRFYRDVLGFELWLDNRSKVSAGSLPSGQPVGAPSRFVIMKGRHPWIGMVGLLQYGESRAAQAPPETLQPGATVLMIETDQLDVIYARMQQAGTPIYRAPETNEVEGAGGLRWQATFLFAFDPDGHMLEINQRGPTVQSESAPVAAAAAVRVERRFVPVRTGQLHLRRAAPVAGFGLRTPVVLLHQTPLSGRMFSELLPQLARDRVVYAPDTPGYGESDPPANVPQLGDYCDALHDFIGELREPVDLVGYHTGALIAAECAVRYPAEIRRLVLISMPLFSAARRATLNVDAALTEDGSALLAEWRSTMSVRPPGQSLEQAARIVAEKQRAGARAAWAMSAVQQYEPESRLRLIRQPTAIVRVRDGLWDQSAAAAALIPESRLLDAPEWSFGLFDAFPAAVAERIRSALD